MTAYVLPVAVTVGAFVWGYLVAVTRVGRVTVTQLRKTEWDDVLAYSDDLEVALIPAPIRRLLDRKMAEHSDERRS